MTAPALDLDQYAARIGLRSLSGPPTEERPAEIQLAHATTVPFENLDIHLALPIQLEPERVFEKLVVRKRGGYCFEQNALLLTMLRKVGFEVRPLTARVLHVQIGGRAFLADVGFGTHNLLGPLALEYDVAREVCGETFRVTSTNDIEVRIGETWTALYRLSLEEQDPVDFVMGNWFTSTHPSSIFVRSKVVSLGAIGKRTLLLDRELKIREGSSITTRTIKDEPAYLAALRDLFGIHLPDGAVLRW